MHDIGRDAAFFEKDETKLEKLGGDDSNPNNSLEFPTKKAKKPMGEPAMQGVGPAAKGVEHAIIGIPNFAALFADVATIKAEVGGLKDVNKSLEGIIFQHAKF